MSLIRRRPRLPVVATVLALSVLPALAQEDAGFSTRGIQGTVMDRDGHPMVGAVVELENTRTLLVRTFITQKDGKYHFEELYSDLDYRIRAMRAGVFGPAKHLSRFNGSKDATVNLKLGSSP
jgi:hypothetical protein